MEQRPEGYEDPGGQGYCSECGQPIPRAAWDEATPPPHSQPDDTEPRAAVQTRPVSTTKRARGRPRARARARASTAAPPPGEPGRSSQPPAKPWYRKPRLVVPLGILAVVAAIAAVSFGAFLGGKSKSGATAQPTASTQSQASKGKQTPVSKWAHENKSKNGRLATSIKAVAAADVADPYTSTLRSACQEMADASRAVAGGLPTPNAALTNTIRSATDSFNRAAQECITGIDGRDPAALDRFRSELDAGQKQTAAMAYILQRFEKR
jgi:hypothetical protein